MGSKTSNCHFPKATFLLEKFRTSFQVHAFCIPARNFVWSVVKSPVLLRSVRTNVIDAKDFATFAMS